MARIMSRVISKRGLVIRTAVVTNATGATIFERKSMLFDLVRFGNMSITASNRSTNVFSSGGVNGQWSAVPGGKMSVGISNAAQQKIPSVSFATDLLKLRPRFNELSEMVSGSPVGSSS